MGGANKTKQIKGSKKVYNWDCKSKYDSRMYDIHTVYLHNRYDTLSMHSDTEIKANSINQSSIVLWQKCQKPRVH